MDLNTAHAEAIRYKNTFKAFEHIEEVLHAATMAAQAQKEAEVARDKALKLATETIETARAEATRIREDAENFRGEVENDIARKREELEEVIRSYEADLQGINVKIAEAEEEFQSAAIAQSTEIDLLQEEIMRRRKTLEDVQGQIDKVKEAIDG